MKLYLRKRNALVDAIADYDVKAKRFVVFKGSVVSEYISYSEKFRAAKAIESARKGLIKNNRLTKDVVFKSPSTAANFVTGVSTNGLTAWRNEEGKKLKQALAEIEAYE